MIQPGQQLGTIADLQIQKARSKWQKIVAQSSCMMNFSYSAAESRHKFADVTNWTIEALPHQGFDCKVQQSGSRLPSGSS
jgi:hypothetical protein